MSAKCHKPTSAGLFDNFVNQQLHPINATQAP